MCSPAFTPPLFDVDVGSTDEEAMLFLGGRKAGDPIPANVITEVNPFSLEPWDSSVFIRSEPSLKLCGFKALLCFIKGMWYLHNGSNYQSCTEGRNIKVTRTGYWKPMDDITIFRDDATAGIRITLEFYLGPEPFGNRTGWIMHEYHRDQKACYGSNLSQDYDSMCRVFLQNDRSSKFCDFYLPNEEQHSPFNSYDDDDAEHIESMLMRILEDEGSSSSIDAPNRSQPFIGSEQVVQAVAGSKHDEGRPPTLVNTSFQDLNSSSASDPHAYLRVSMDEYLELNDLYDPDPASSGSNNSSINSIYSDEYFNSEELIRYLGSPSSQNMQEEHKDYKFCVSTSANPVNVVIKPSQPAGLIACHNSHQVGEEHVLADEVHSRGNASKPCSSAYDSCIQSHPKRTHSRSSESSSSSYGSGSKSLHRIVKFGNKYCCFRTL